MIAATGCRSKTLSCQPGCTARARRRSRFWPAFLLCLVVSGLSSPAWALSGDLEYQGGYSRLETGQASSSRLSQTGTLRLRESTSLWEPWFAQLSGTLGFSLTRSRAYGSGQPDQSSSGALTTGSSDLTVFPSSRFPLSLWLARNDTRSTSDRLFGPATTSERTVTRYGLQQSYRREGGGNYVFRLEETTVEAEAGATQRDERLNWTFSGNESFSEHDVGFNIGEDTVRQKYPEQRVNKQDRVSVRHRYSPAETSWNVNNLASWNRRETRILDSDSQQQRGQLSSSTQWTSGGERRLRFNGSVRAEESRNDSGAAESEQQLVATNLGLGYRLSERWRVGASAGATVRENDSGNPGAGVEADRLITQQYSADADYTAPSREFAGFRHAWNVNISSAYRSSEDQTDGTYNANAALGLGQSLSRPLAAGSLGRLQGRLNQSASHRESSVGEPSSSLSHGAGLSWNQSLANGSAYGDLQFTDSRQYQSGEPDQVFQLANAQLSLQRQLSAEQSFSFNTTLQASRSGGEEGYEDWRPSTSISMTYLQQGVLSLHRMRWYSDLGYESDNLLYLLRDESSLGEREQLRWENRLDYSIGLLTTRFTATLTENGEVFGQAYRLTLTRRF